MPNKTEATKTSSAAIVRILDVVDTRTFEEVEDRMVPVAGSGTENECDRCGRLHVVHALVELADGTQATVGTGCMGADSMAAALKRSASTATTVRKLEGKVAALEAKVARSRAAVAEAAQLTPPAIVDTTIERFGDDDVIEVVQCGDAQSWITNRTRDEAVEVAVQLWRNKRARELGRDELAAAQLADVQRRLESARKRFAAKLAK